MYDEQYAHIDCVEKYRALPKDAKKGNFVEGTLDGQREEMPVNFSMKAISRFGIPDHIFITTGGSMFTVSPK